MKVAIIGGGGLVGSGAGFALPAGGIVREIAMIDANAEAADGQALDLVHGSAFLSDQISATLNGSSVYISAQKAAIYSVSPMPAAIQAGRLTPSTIGSA